MRKPFPQLVALAVLAAGLPLFSQAADNDTARLREMLHRTQEALRQAQSDNADLTKAKLDAERKVEDSGKQLETLRTTSLKAQSSRAASLQSQLDAAHTAQETSQHGLEDANRQLTALNTKLAEAMKQLAARDAQLKETSVSLDQSKAANSMCEAKNVTLYGYAEDVLLRFRKKGVWASLSQKDPVFGFKEVDEQNVVQEYQLKYDSQKVKP